MLKEKKREVGEFNASSMADITFLLLVFFLVTTTISSNKGIDFFLPSKQEEVKQQKSRGLVQIILNDDNQVFISGKGIDKTIEVEEVKNNITLMKREISKAGDDVIVSIQLTPNSSYKKYISIIDQLKGAKIKYITLVD